jgi:hypothetical protein
MYGAWLSTRLGERDQAFEWLDKALAERSPLLLYLNIDPKWDSLRSDPRFDHLTNELPFRQWLVNTIRVSRAQKGNA